MPVERLGNLLNPKEIEGLEQVLARTKEIARLTGALAASLDGTRGAKYDAIVVLDADRDHVAAVVTIAQLDHEGAAAARV